MAKTQSIINVSGKLGDKVYVNGRHGRYVRNAPAKGLKKDEAALKEQYSNTAFINNLASQVWRALKVHAVNFAATETYTRMLKLFRRAAKGQCDRWTMLRHLEGLEVNPLYPLQKHGVLNWQIHPGKKSFKVDLQVAMHPPGKVGVHKVDCYYYELVALVWDKSKRPPVSITNETEWIDREGGRPGFRVPLPLPVDAKHWLLFIHLWLGKQGKAIDVRATEGMQCVAAGSFDKKERAMTKGSLLKEPGIRKTKEKKEGVKARVMK